MRLPKFAIVASSLRGGGPNQYLHVSPSIIEEEAAAILTIANDGTHNQSADLLLQIASAQKLVMQDRRQILEAQKQLDEGHQQFTQNQEDLQRTLNAFLVKKKVEKVEMIPPEADSWKTTIEAFLTVFAATMSLMSVLGVCTIFNNNGCAPVVVLIAMCVMFDMME